MQPPQRRHTLLFLVTLASLTAFTPLAIDMYLPSLPSIQRELATSASAVQLTLSAFMAGLCVAQLAYGPLADRFGRRRPLFAGIALYLAASIACAFAPSIGWLIALRFLQAAGGSAGPVIARAIVRDHYRGNEAARVLSILMLIMGAAPIFAPLAGGWVLAVVGWRAVFLVLALLGLAALVLAFAVLPRDSDSTRRRASEPMFVGVRRVLADPRFVAGTLAGGFASAAMFAYISGAPFVLMELHHVPPDTFAKMFGLNAMGIIGASQLNRWLLDRFPASRIASTGSRLASGTALHLTGIAWTRAGGVIGISAALFVLLATNGLVSPNASALAMDGHGERAGLASALLGSAGFAAPALASATVGLLNDGTAVPMALVMTACACASALATHRQATLDRAPDESAALAS